MALFLKDNDVQQSVSMSEMLEAIENMQNRYGRGEAYNLARRKIIAPGGLLSVMGGVCITIIFWELKHTR